jgi:tetratricopeptide (TPR) repeat protein
MAKQFFLKRGKKVVGPMEAADMKRRASNGQIIASDEFSKSRTGPWQRVDSAATLRNLVGTTEDDDSATVQTTLPDNLRLAKNCTVCLHCWRKCPDKPKKSFLRFIQVKCPRCSRKSTYPFSRWALVGFWFSVVSFVPWAAFGIFFFSESWLTLVPSTGLIIALYGLRRDREILRSLKNPSGPAPHERPVIDKLVIAVVLLLNVVGSISVQQAEEKQKRILELNNEGLILLERENFDLAKDKFSLALQVNPDFVGGYYNRGFISLQQGKHDEAIADFSAAITIQQVPGFGMTPTRKFFASLQERFFETERSDIRTLRIALAQGYNLRGLAHHAKNNNEKALLDFSEAIRLHPLAAHLVNRGTTYLDMDDHEKARADIIEAKKIDPGLQLPPRVLHLSVDPETVDPESVEPTTLEGHSALVASVSFSPDGKRIASGSRDKTVKVWDAQTGKEMLTLKGHSSLVNSVSFSPDGKRIVSGGWDDKVKVWDAETGQLMLTLKGHTSYVTSVIFSPNGKRIVSGGGQFGVGEPGEIKVWDAETGQETLTLAGHTGQVVGVSFSPDGKRILSGSRDKTLKIWDAETGQETLTLEGHAQGVSALSFSPDGTHIVSGSREFEKPCQIMVWDAETGQETATLHKRHSYSVRSVSFSPDGKSIVSGSGATVTVWSAETGLEILTLVGHSNLVYSVSFSPDGKRIVSGGGGGGEPGEIKVWDISSLDTSR